jgi:hypothetical protein
MMKNSITISCFRISIILFLILISQGVSAQIYNLKFEEINTASTGFEVEIYINGSTPFKIATSNLVFSYADSVVVNPNLVSDELEDNYTIEVDEKSTKKVDFNLVYNDIHDPASGFEVDAAPAWTKLGTVKFDVVVSGSTAVLDWLESSKSETVIYNTTGERLSSGTLSGIFSATTLPLELITFDARPNNKDVILDWITAYEENFEGFNIERSLNGETFDKIGTQKSLGNSTSRTEYRWIDKNVPSVNRLYYRLKMMDLDGLFEYSTIEVVNFKYAHFSSLDISPNPMKHSTQLSFHSSHEGKVNLSISDMSGKILQRKEYAIQEGSNDIRYEAMGIPNGQYLFTLEMEGQKVSKSIIVLE